MDVEGREEGRRKKEEGRRKKEEGRRKKEEGRRKKEEGRRRKKEENIRANNCLKIFVSLVYSGGSIPLNPP
ncbi:MAG: hypothetical protein EAZ25_00760 [Oscillatoriales cyanobacterium]|nr:MAG: hypothetical protein EAZ25_00760 [Oscillatoriales cyanobacterium]